MPIVAYANTTQTFLLSVTSTQPLFLLLILLSSKHSIGSFHFWLNSIVA